MILSKGRKPKKEVLLEELAKEDLQVLSLAYVYAKNMQMYGVDVTKAICSATENVAMMENAYRKGYHDCEERYEKWKQERNSEKVIGTDVCSLTDKVCIGKDCRICDINNQTATKEGE